MPRERGEPGERPNAPTHPANSARIFVPNYGGKLGHGFTKAEKLDSLIHPGRRKDGSQSAASWVTELSDGRKAILLCNVFCKPKFNWRRNKYVAKFNLNNGMCDACRELTDNMGGGTLFIAEEYRDQLIRDPQRNRVAKRMGLRSDWRKFFRK